MSTPSSILTILCRFNGYENWDHQIHENVLKFFETHIKYPNLMLASQKTWDKIDIYANENNPENINPPDHGAYNICEEIKSISTFETSDYSLSFCLADTMDDDSFLLVLDEDPVFDDGSDEDSDAVYVRMARSVKSVRHIKSRRRKAV